MHVNTRVSSSFQVLNELMRVVMARKESTSVALHKGRKRVSKKNKIAWRKHCNTNDVDLFLDELRHEERVGVNICTANDDKLFFIDKTKGVPEEDNVNSKTKRKLNAMQKLVVGPKCHEILLPLTTVSDPVIKRNRVHTPEERKHPIKKKAEAYRRAHGKLTVKEKETIENRNLQKIRKENEPKLGDFTKDLWNEVPVVNPEVDFQWLNPTTHRHVLKNTRKIQKKVPMSVRSKTSVLPAVEIPHPGTSYNPSYLDHRALLEDIAQNENKLIKEDKHIERVTSEMFSQVTPEENFGAWMKELLQGLPQSDEVTVKEEVVRENFEYKPVNPPTKDKKKTRKQRKNMRLAKEEEQQRKLKAIEKKKVADIYKLKNIVQNVEDNELKSLENQALMQKKKELKKLETKRLSKVKFERPEPDFNMPYDLSGNLRGLKTEGNILKDCYKSLQKRNMLEPTVVRKARKVKRKVVTKNSHK